MILVILAVSLSLIFLFVYMSEKVCNCEDIFEILAFISMIITAISLVLTICLACSCATSSKIDEIIDMYQEENTAIESNMDELVKGYMEYEKTTLEKFSPESSITLVSLYPELKADELVQRQIDVYMANNAKIKDLKEKKIYRSVKRWWLYFGR